MIIDYLDFGKFSVQFSEIPVPDSDAVPQGPAYLPTGGEEVVFDGAATQVERRGGLFGRTSVVDTQCIYLCPALWKALAEGVFQRDEFGCDDPLFDVARRTSCVEEEVVGSRAAAGMAAQIIDHPVAGDRIDERHNGAFVKQCVVFQKAGEDVLHQIFGIAGRADPFADVAAESLAQFDVGSGNEPVLTDTGDGRESGFGSHGRL